MSAKTGGSETILLVEDEEAVRNLARRILRSNGYVVLAAASAAEALAFAADSTNHVDMLLTDVVMPQMDGRELSEKLHVLRPSLKVLFMSGYTDDEVLRHGVETSSIAFIEKPLVPEKLAAKVREVLDGGHR